MSDPHRRLFAGSIAIAAACAHHAAPSSGTGALPSPRPGLAVYDGSAAINPATGDVQARWHIDWVPRSGDSVRLILNGGFRVSDVRGPSVARFSTAPRNDDQTVTVFLKPDVANRPTSLDITYGGVLRPPSDKINGVSAEWVELALDSFWQPIIGDFSQAIVSRVRLTLPRGYTLAASGTLDRVGDSVVVLTNTVALPDVPFSASRAFIKEDSAGTRVFYTGPRVALVGALLATTESCSAYLNRLYGQSEPLPPRTMVLAPRTGPGYARKNYIVITGLDTSRVGVGRFVCHELAHYWSIHANSSGPDNWMNEGFAEFVSAQYVRSAIGQTAYAEIVESWRKAGENQGPVWTPTITRRPGAAISYRKAPYLLSRLEERVGGERMQRILRRYMAEPIATTPDLLRVIGEVAGVETGDWFRELLAR